MDEVMGNRPDRIIKNQKEKTCIPINAAIPRTEMSRKGSGKETKIQEFMYRDTTNVEHEMKIIPVINGTTGMVTKF